MTDDMKTSWTIARGILIAVAVLFGVYMLATLPVVLLAPLVGFGAFCWVFGKAMDVILPKGED